MSQHRFDGFSLGTALGPEGPGQHTASPKPTGTPAHRQNRPEIPRPRRDTDSPALTRTWTTELTRRTQPWALHTALSCGRFRPHFASEETEAQGGDAMCLCQSVELGLFQAADAEARFPYRGNLAPEV